MDNDAKQEREAIAAQFIETLADTDQKLAALVRENAQTIIDALRQPHTDALKKARGAINGLLDIISDYNLDSEQAGRAFAALHEIGTALAVPVQATGQPHLEALTAENKRLREALQETRWVWERHKYNGEFTHFLEQHICAALDALGFEIREKGQ